MMPDKRGGASETGEGAGDGAEMAGFCWDG